MDKNDKELLKLLENRVDAVEAANNALDEFHKYCENRWGITFHGALNIDEGDHIVDWLNYGGASPNLQDFIKFMNKAKKHDV